MSTDTRSHVHALVDQLPPNQLAAVETLLESMVDPFIRKLAAAPIDDEPFTAEEQQAVSEALEWSKENNQISLEAVLADFGLTKNDWELMGNTLPPQENGSKSG